MSDSNAVPSDEVANDWKEALEDLREPSEASIFNLVTIARENMDSAQAIARTTIQHIKNVKSSQAKLNAFYVVDAIVKRIRSPYTMYFGHNLYNLFMGAYTTMDNQNRQHMDKLFETWLVPVPGSWTQELVFEPQYTRPIQEALVKWRSVLQQQQQTQRPVSRAATRPAQQSIPALTHQAQPDYRSTPPPQLPRFQQPGSNRYSSPTPFQTGPLPVASQSQPVQSHQQSFYGPYPTQTPSTSYGHPLDGFRIADVHQNGGSWYPSPAEHPEESISQDNLKQVIGKVMRNAATEYQRFPQDRIGNLLRTLASLNAVVSSQGLPPASISQIYGEITRIGAEFMPPEPLHTMTHSNSLYPTAYVPAPGRSPQLTSNTVAAPQDSSYMQPAPNSSANVPAAQLIALLGASSDSHVSLPPVNSAPIPAASVREETPVNAAPSLFEQLKAAGLLSVTNSAPSYPADPTTSAATSEVNLARPATIRAVHPDLVERLYSAKPDQCRQCGRRFSAMAAGKEAKGKHMDWHFKTNTRVADSQMNKGVVNRSWYIDEREWVDYREDTDGIPLQAGTGDGTGRDPDSKSKVARGRRDYSTQWVTVPTDPKLASEPCPICMEKFTQRWEASIDQPVWIDAMKVADKIYHASCYDEVMKGQQMAVTTGSGKTGLGVDEAGTSARITPDPVLGKRKYES